MIMFIMLTEKVCAVSNIKKEALKVVLSDEMRKDWIVDTMIFDFIVLQYILGSTDFCN